MWQTRFSKEIGTEWLEIKIEGSGLIESSHGNLRYVLGKEKPTDEFIGTVQQEGVEHEFYNQTVWIRAGEGKALVSVQDLEE
jgi:hypothetical protein